ncbi:MAG: RNA polymerase sigma factor [Oscillospiraceae bacterium]|nr:RNA polymerase sigma factor [Oscillospiraceae bacterium]
MDDFEAIYAQYFARVYRYALWLTGSGGAAEELTAETFFKALKKIDGFGGGNMQAWLCQIAKNHWVNQRRRKGREVPLDEDFDRESEEAPPHLALESGEAAGALHQKLHGLPEPYREVFTLRVFCELPFAQIAALFGKTESWARVAFHRARNKLQSELQPELEA